MNLLLQPFKTLIKQRSGLMFDGISEENLEKAVQRRMDRLGLQDAPRYLQQVSRDGGEFDELVSLLTINETYFYREAEQLRLLTETLIPRLLARQEEGKPLRILSAGCSTGEEPYSIAMAALEAFGEQASKLIRIEAGDIDNQALKRAREGVYSPFSFRCLPDALRERYFTPIDGRFRIDDPVRSLVRFQPLNLLGEVIPDALQGVDIVFFRNVSIYFDTATREVILRNLHRMMDEQGLLIVGVAESMANDLGVFELVEEGGMFYFSKLTQTPRPAPGPVPTVELAAPPPRARMVPRPPLETAEVEPSEVLADAQRLLQEKRYDDAGALLRGMLATQLHLKGRLLLAWVYLQQRDFAATQRQAMRILDEDEWSVEAMLLLGFAARFQGDREEALRWFRQAAYARPDNWVVQYYLAEAHRTLGNQTPARRSYRAALKCMIPQGLRDGGLALPLNLPEKEIRFLCEQHSERMGGTPNEQKQ